jgi:hypothetical protein
MDRKPTECEVLPPPGDNVLPSQQARNWAMAAHLSGLLGYVFPFGHIFGPLAIFLLKGDKFPLVDDQGKEALNFQISISIYFLIAAILILAIIGFALLGILVVYHCIAIIVAAVRARGGERFRYPLTIRFIR